MPGELRMSTATITFDQMESRADRALGLTLWAKHAKYAVLLAAILALLNQCLSRVVTSFSPDKLEALSPEQATEATKKLQELHEELVRLLRMHGLVQMKSNAFYRSSIQGLQEVAEDISDIIEDLVLSENVEFRSLLAECAKDLSLPHPAGARGGM